jgi:hypothetical protein
VCGAAVQVTSAAVAALNALGLVRTQSSSKNTASNGRMVAYTGDLVCAEAPSLKRAIDPFAILGRYFAGRRGLGAAPAQCAGG